MNIGPRLRELFNRASRAHVPVTAHLELTRRCNLDCPICYQADREAGAPELETAEWLDVLDQLREMGTLIVLLSGGELFLRRDALEVAKAVRERGMAVRLQTTATLLDDERCRAIADLPVSSVEVTVFSVHAAEHDRATRTPGALRRTLEAVARLRALDVPVLMKTPLVRSAQTGAIAVRALARQLGASHTLDALVTSRDDGDRAPLEERLNIDELATLYAAIDEPPELAAPAGSNDATCGVGRSFLVVGPHGDVTTCVALPLPLGNVRRDRLAELWRDHPTLAKLRAITYQSLHTCGSCQRSGYCDRCPGQALLEDGDLYGPSSASCANAAAKELAVLGYERLPRKNDRVHLRVVG